MAPRRDVPVSSDSHVIDQNRAHTGSVVALAPCNRFHDSIREIVTAEISSVTATSARPDRIRLKRFTSGIAPCAPICPNGDSPPMQVVRHGPGEMRLRSHSRSSPITERRDASLLNSNCLYPYPFAIYTTARKQIGRGQNTALSNLALQPAPLAVKRVSRYALVRSRRSHFLRRRASGPTFRCRLVLHCQGRFVSARTAAGVPVAVATAPGRTVEP